MRPCLISLILLLCIAADARWSDTAETWTFREIVKIQTSFMQEHFTDKRDQAQSLAEIDSLIQEVQQAWAEEAKGRYGDQTHLYSGDYLFFLFNPTSRRINPDRLRHVVEKHQLPAFVHEYNQLRQRPDFEKAIQISASRNMFLHPLRYELPKPLWSSVRKIFESMPLTIEKYLTTVEFEDERTRKQLELMKWDLPQHRPLWATLDLLYLGSLDSAFKKLKASFNQNNSGWFVTIGIRLADKFAGEKRLEVGFDVLDYMIGALDKPLSPRHRSALLQAYVRLDQKNGEIRFQKQVGPRGEIKTPPKKQALKLTGAYKDLTSGRIINLESLSGKIIFIDFWATWCGPCRSEIPDLIAFSERHKGREDFVFISVNGDPVTSGSGEQYVKEFLQIIQINYVVLLDDPKSSLAGRFGVSGWPSKFLLNKKGESVLDTSSGRLTLDQVEAYLSQSN